MPGDRESSTRPLIDPCLAGGGEMGEAMRAMDWACTPLGAVEQWPTALKTAVSFCLNASLPAMIWWGEQRLLLHNDAAQPFVTSDEHPHVLGKPGKVSLPPLWRIVEPAIEHVMAKGEPMRLEDQRLKPAAEPVSPTSSPLRFTCSPIHHRGEDESEAVGGVLCLVEEIAGPEVEEPEQPRQMPDREHRDQAQRRLIERLETERALVTQIIDQVPAGVIIVDALDRKCLYRNPQIDAIFGPGTDTQAWSLDSLDLVAVRPDGQPYTGDQWPLTRALRDGVNVVNEAMEYVTPGGERRTISIDASPIRDKAGRIVAAMAAFHDVTERRRAESNARFLAEASERLASSLNYEAMLRNVAELAVPHLADWCMVHMRDESGDLRQPVVVHNDTAKQAHLHRLLNHNLIQVSVRCSVAATLRSGESTWVPEVNEELLRQVTKDELHLRQLQELEMCSWMCVPLKIRGTVRGAVTFISDASGRRYSEDDLHLAEELARLAGLEIDNARLYGDAQRELKERERAERQLEARLAQQAAVSELGQQALAGGLLQPLLDRAVYVVAETLNTELAEVLQLLPEREQLLLRAGIGWRGGIVGHATFDVRSNTQASYTLRSERPVIVEDLWSETRFSGPEMLFEHGVVSGMSVVIPGEEGVPWGALGVHSTKRHHFTLDDAHFLHAVANVLAVTIQRRRWERTLHASEQRERARADELAAIMEATPAVLFIAHDREARRITGSRQAYEFLRLPREANLSKLQSSDEALDHFHVYIDGREARPHELPVQRAARGEEVREHEMIVEFENGERHYLFGHAMPLHDEHGEPRGAVAAFMDVTDQHRLMTQLQQFNATLEQRVAERTAEAEHRASQLRALAAQLTQAEQYERRRLAQTLHDHLQQLLVGVKMQLAMLTTADAAVLPDMVGELSELMDQAIESSRSLSHDLSPPILYDAGLIAALHWLVPQKRSKYGIELDVQADEDAEPEAEDVKVFLFQAVRELLLNVVKHADAKVAQVTMERMGDEVCVAVKDEGVGFDPASVGGGYEAEHFGLFGIRERLEALGGRLKIDSAPGSGTVIYLYAPLHIEVRADGDVPDDPSDQPRPKSTPDVANQQVEQPESDIPQIRVLLADDHEVVRSGLRTMLEQQPDIHIIAEADDGEAAITLTQEHRPDVVVMDVTMPRLNGIEATRRIHEQMPDVRVIGLSMHEREAMAEAMLAAGAVVYLPKGGAAEDLITAIRAGATGEQ